MSGGRSRLVGAMWWLLLATPAVSLAIQLSTGYRAHSPDEAYGGLGPDGMLVVLAAVLAIVILARVASRWRRTGRSARIESLTAALALIPLMLAIAAIGELVGWPRTRTAGAARFTTAALLVLGWMALVLLARMRFRGADWRVRGDS